MLVLILRLLRLRSVVTTRLRGRPRGQELIVERSFESMGSHHGSGVWADTSRTSRDLWRLVGGHGVVYTGGY